MADAEPPVTAGWQNREDSAFYMTYVALDPDPISKTIAFETSEIRFYNVRTDSSFLLTVEDIGLSTVGDCSLTGDAIRFGSI